MYINSFKLISKRRVELFSTKSFQQETEARNMLRMLIWVFSFLLSLGVKYVPNLPGWISQGVAFLILYLFGNLLLFVISGVLRKSSKQDFLGEDLSRRGIIWGAFVLGVILVSTWAASVIGNLDYFVVLQLMTFGYSAAYWARIYSTRVY